MNAMVRLAHARGMAGDGPRVDPVAFEREFGPAPALSTPGHSTRDLIFGAIGAGLQTVASLRNRNNTQQQGDYTAAQLAQIQAQQAGFNPSATPSGGVGLGIDGQGVRLSDGSHIGWLPIGAVALGFMLLQSKGISRR